MSEALQAPLPARVLDFILAREGCDLARGDYGLVNDPRDPGGLTKMGLSQRAYPNVDIKALTVDDARRLYERDYWHAGRCDALEAATPPRSNLALVHMDACVNQGVGAAVRMLQRAVGATPDGDFGPATLAASLAADEAAAVRAYLLARAAAYRTIADRRPASRAFLRGWLARLRSCARATGQPVDPFITETP